MSHDDRIRAAFDDLQRQTSSLAPPPIEEAGEHLHRATEAGRRGWLSAVAAAAVIVVAVGAVVFLGGGDEGSPPAGTTDTTTATTSVSSSATTSAQVTTSDPTTDTTTATTEPTTTSTRVLALELPPDVGTGWRVVDVASDDVLNVRAGGRVDSPIVGTLAHDDVDVRLNGLGATQLDGTGWWGVILDDGAEGFVNKRFLAPPGSWYRELDFPCSAIPTDGPGDQAEDLDGWDPSSNATGIIGLSHVRLGECDRYVISLGSSPMFEAPVEADSVPDGITVTSRAGEVLVDFGGTESVRGVDATATVARVGPAMVLTSVPGGADLSLAPRVHIFTSGGRLAIQGVHYLSDPARVVIDVVGADPEATSVLLPDDGPTVVVGVEVIDDTRVLVRGFARWFEAQGIAMLFDATGSPFPGTWTGPSVPEGQFGQTSMVFAPWDPTWGEFTFEVEKIPPGDYTLFVGESCVADESGDVWVDCGVTMEFTIP